MNDEPLIDDDDDDEGNGRETDESADAGVVAAELPAESSIIDGESFIVL